MRVRLAEPMDMAAAIERGLPLPPGPGARYFGIPDKVVAPIRIEWTGARGLTVAVDGGRAATWSIALASTAMTRLLTRIAARFARDA